MASSFAIFEILGNVGRDPEQETWNDVSRCRINIAHTKKWKNNAGEKHEQTYWFSVTAWRGSADILSQYVKKGDRLLVKGELTNREIETDNGGKHWVTNFTVTDFSLLGSSNGNGNNKPAQRTNDNNSYNNEAPPF